MITAVRKVGEYLGGVALIHAALHNTVTLVPCTTHRLASTHTCITQHTVALTHPVHITQRGVAAFHAAVHNTC